MKFFNAKGYTSWKIYVSGTYVGEGNYAEVSMAGEEAIQVDFKQHTLVSVDLKPGSDPNSINLRSKGVIPVAILTNNTFDATNVDPLSVEFGPNRATEAHGKGHVEDADGDGVSDLVLHFNTQETGIQCGDTEATLTGETLDGQAIERSDSINMVGCM